MSVLLVENPGVKVQNLKQCVGCQHQLKLSFLLSEALKSDQTLSPEIMDQIAANIERTGRESNNQQRHCILEREREREIANPQTAQ